MKEQQRSKAYRATEESDPAAPAAISRRGFVKAAGIAGVVAATAAVAAPSAAVESPRPDGTPEQIHLTWGQDPSRMVCVSWVSPAAAVNARVTIVGPDQKSSVIAAVERRYTDGLNGQTVFTYHARLGALVPDSKYQYSVTADNSRDKTPFGATFRTAPVGRAPFRWTSYGDLATPVPTWVLSSPQSYHAVDAVEHFDPLFHLLNGDLCYANLNPMSQPSVWADFGHNVQRSAANRPWMPCPGNHEIEFGNGADGLNSYLTRYCLPDNGTTFAGRWYSFRVGSAIFISLAADDVVYQDSGSFVAGPNPIIPASTTGNAPIPPGTSLYVRGYSKGAQTRWLEHTLSAAHRDTDIDWIIVQMHQDALSSTQYGNGSDKGIREAWLPLFDRYGVDLVLCGHDHDYERSWPVRGCRHDVGRDAETGAVVDTCQPQPVITSETSGEPFDSSRGTVHLVLGGGGTSAPLDVYGTNPKSGKPQAKVLTRRNRLIPGPVAGVFVKQGADAVEDAVWSARRDTVSAYGIALFELDPNVPGGRTSITMRYYHAVGADKAATANYTLFDTLVLNKARHDLKI